MFTYTIHFLKPNDSRSLNTSGNAMLVNRSNPISKDDLINIKGVGLAPSAEWIGCYAIWRVAVILHLEDPTDPVNQGRTIIFVQPFSKSEEFTVQSLSVVL